MFSRNLSKNVDKYSKSIKYFKGKWNFKGRSSNEILKKFAPIIESANEKCLNILEDQRLAVAQQYGRDKMNQVRSIMNNRKLQSLRSVNFKNKILFASTGFTVIETQGKQVQTATVVTPPPTATILHDTIPEPPTIAPEAIDAVTGPFSGEAPFESLGLGGWTPVGMVQNCLEYLHIGLDVPWWGAIMIGTIVVRVLMFPLVVISQRNAAKMNNHMPQLQVLQLKMSDARQTGNQLDAARYGQEMVQFMKEKQLNPLKNMLVPLAQMPLFVSFFIGLRQMANCPVQSMQEGGLFWFADLTLPDQFFILPIITSVTMWATIEMGTDTGKLSAQNMQTMKYVLRAMPLIVLPFTINFPGAILCYWVCTNFISLGQVGVLRIPAVRQYFKIEALVTHDPDNLPIKKKGFVSGMKESWTNMKISNEIEGRKRYDEMQFQRAGKGPIVKTYKFDPTKQNPAISAKKSS